MASEEGAVVPPLPTHLPGLGLATSAMVPAIVERGPFGAAPYSDGPARLRAIVTAARSALTPEVLDAPAPS